MTTRAEGAARLRLVMEDFDAAPVRPPAAAAPGPVGCTCARCREDTALPLCRAEAWEDGRRAGEAMHREIDQAAAAALAGRIATALAAADDTIATLADDAATAIGRAVIAMATAALPAACARLGTREAASLAAAILPTLANEPAVTIEAAPDAQDPIAAALARLPERQRARVRLVCEATLAPGDLHLSWQGGSVRRDAAGALARVRAVLDQFGLLEPADPIPASLESLSHG